MCTQVIEILLLIVLLKVLLRVFKDETKLFIYVITCDYEDYKPDVVIIRLVLYGVHAVGVLCGEKKAKIGCIIGGEVESRGLYDAVILLVLVVSGNIQPNLGPEIGLTFTPLSLIINPLLMKC